MGLFSKSKKKKETAGVVQSESTISASASSVNTSSSKNIKKTKSGKFWKSKKNLRDTSVPFDSGTLAQAELKEPLPDEYDYDVKDVSNDETFMRASAGQVAMDAIEQKMMDLEKKYAAAMEQILQNQEKEKEEKEKAEAEAEAKKKAEAAKDAQKEEESDQLAELGSSFEGEDKSNNTSNATSLKQTKSILKKSTKFSPETFLNQQSVRRSMTESLRASGLDMSALTMPSALGTSTIFSASTTTGKSITAGSGKVSFDDAGNKTVSIMEDMGASASGDSTEASESVSMDDGSANRMSVHHVAKKGKTVTKSFKKKKSFLGVKEEQKNNDLKKSMAQEVDVDALRASDPNMLDAVTMNMDPEFDSAFAPDDMRCLALVSHNNMKASMKQFVIANQNCLKKFRLTGTNTTMTMLRSVFGDDPDVVYGPACASGPLGGDAQLVAMAVTGEIGGCIFFIDPMDAHPHSADIDTLVRQGNVYNLVMMNNPSTAHVCLNALRLALRMGRMELFPSFFFDLESPSVPEYKKRQQAVLDARIAEKV